MVKAGGQERQEKSFRQEDRRDRRDRRRVLGRRAGETGEEKIADNGGKASVSPRLCDKIQSPAIDPPAANPLPKFANASIQS